MYKFKKFLSIFLITFLLYLLITDCLSAGYYCFANPLFYLVFSFIIIWYFKNYKGSSILPIAIVCFAGIMSVYNYIDYDRSFEILSVILIFIAIPYVFSYLYNKKLSLAKAVSFSVLSILSLVFLFLTVYIYYSNIYIFSNLSYYLNKYAGIILVKIINIYKQMGISDALINKFKPELIVMLKDMFLLAPSILVIFLWFSLWISFIILKNRTTKDKDNNNFFRNDENLLNWKASDFLIVGLVVGLVIIIFANGLYKFIGYNIIIVLASVFFVQGLTILAFYFKKNNVNKILRFFAYAIIFLFGNPFLIFIVMLGIFDEWFDFRKVNSINIK
ncbi:MAG: DUF2232 domain-containing protein [Candidatus Acididesulfobacter diazotrophicus]|uniref:DUF2232 domain-containing protein n=1 Tax=Candidatus Acididesulfobacter diazotrophicus TaxID=2597226 RepID=A0A519BKN3_9DELT|nr:MAG: DUF2232 domain-containing protein [Candidatus Acididesulfobacter diazotrophicus]